MAEDPALGGGEGHRLGLRTEIFQKRNIYRNISRGGGELRTAGERLQHSEASLAGPAASAVDADIVRMMEELGCVSSQLIVIDQ